MINNSTIKFLDRSTPPSIFTIICLSAVGALAMNMHLPSLPAMADTFNVSYSAATLTVTLFLAMNAVFQFVVGPLSDRFGRRPIVLICMAIFCLSSVGCIFSTKFEMFLFCRLIQAIVVAGLVLSRAAIRDVYSQDRAASVLGYATMGMAILPLVGPAVGGNLEVHFGWVASFWVLLGVGILVFTLAYFDMGETNKQKSSSMAVQFRAYPELLRSRRFWGYCITATFSAGAYFAYLGGAAFVGREIFNLSPGILGFYLGAPAVGYIAGNGLSGRFSVGLGINRMILTGTIITAVGMTFCILLFLFTVPIPLSFFGCVCFMGLGNGMVLPNATAGMMSVRPHLAGAAYGLGGSISIAGGAALSTLAGVILVPGSTEMPLLLLMWASSLCGVGIIIFVRQRNKTLHGNT